ncbi:hypothetical protein KIPB_003569 [Kipferlia bialata]|uniref:Uncharacterized protein n=1 Tax=Kipferlia bialata TaxID=797122 RepID=A0A9K3CTW6_9EUKA|nr:hypothetical protein KIPB_003569 [Kipferlia bialata]|eukprot:g3569.t1
MGEPGSVYDYLYPILTGFMLGLEVLAYGFLVARRKATSWSGFAFTALTLTLVVSLVSGISVIVLGKLYPTLTGNSVYVVYPIYYYLSAGFTGIMTVPVTWVYVQVFRGILKPRVFTRVHRCTMACGCLVFTLTTLVLILSECGVYIMLKGRDVPPWLYDTFMSQMQLYNITTCMGTAMLCTTFIALKVLYGRARKELGNLGGDIPKKQFHKIDFVACVTLVYSLASILGLWLDQTATVYVVWGLCMNVLEGVALVVIYMPTQRARGGGRQTEV